MPPTLLFDRSDRTRLQFSGPHGVATLNGLVTNDVAALAPGMGGYAAALTAKGKMVADLRMFMRESGPLVDVSPLASRSLRDMFAKYVNPRFATITDVTESLHDLGVFGDASATVVAAVVGVPPTAIATLAEYAHTGGVCNGAAVMVARVPDLGVDGYELFVPSGGVDALRNALCAAGAVPGDAQMWRTLRVVAGRPEWGTDMDENTLPQEANLDALHGVSYDKGCYIGQETVARIHFRGHVNRMLRRIIVDDRIEPPAGSALVDGEGTHVGDVRSTATWPADDAAPAAVVGIGMVRREIAEGTRLTARWDGGAAHVHVAGPADGRNAPGNAKGAID